MNNSDTTYIKQEKIFRMFFLILMVALGGLFYDVFFSKSSTSTPSSALLPAPARLLEGPLCMLGKEPGLKATEQMLELCCLNKQKLMQ